MLGYDAGQPQFSAWAARDMIALDTILNAFLLVYAALFPIVNPIGGAPIGLTQFTTDPNAMRWRGGWRSTACFCWSGLCSLAPMCWNFSAQPAGGAGSAGRP